jgi:outer membrane receptor protein involved in Fe transport
MLQAIAVSLTAQTTAPSTAVEGNATKPDDDKEALRLSPFEVKATSEEDGYLTRGSSSAARIAVDYLDLAQTVSVMSSQFISDYNIQDTRKMLEHMPNVSTGITDQSNRIWIRGSEINTIYVDGVRAYHQTSMPLQFFDRVELVSGPSSAAFGVGQPGGIINYTTKAPTGRSRGTIEVGIGTYNNYLVNLDTEEVLPVKLPGKTLYRFVGYYKEGDLAQRPLTHGGAGGLLALRNDLNDTTRVDIAAEYSRNTFPLSDLNFHTYQNQTAYAWHQSIFVGRKAANGNPIPDGVTTRIPVPNSNPWPGIAAAEASNGHWIGGDLWPKGSSFYPEHGWSMNNTADQFKGTAKLEKLFLERALAVRVTGTILNVKSVGNYLTSAAWAYINPATQQPYSTAPTGLPFPNHVYIGKLEEYGARFTAVDGRTNLNYRTVNLDINYQKDNFLWGNWRFSVGGSGNSLASENWSDTMQLTNQDGTFTWIAFNTPAEKKRVFPEFSSRTRTAANQSVNYQYGLYANFRGSYFGDRVAIEFGDRRDTVSGHTDNYLSGTTTQIKKFTTKGAPRIALTYKPFKWLSIYALRSEQNDPPNLVQRYALSQPGINTAALLAKYNNFEERFEFTPQSVLKEFGIKAELLQGKMIVAASVFDYVTAGSIITNIIRDDVVSSPTFQSSVVERFPSANRAKGGEISVTGKLGQRLNLRAFYGITRGLYSPFPPSANFPAGRDNPIDPPTTTGVFVKYDVGTFRGFNVYLLGGGTRWGPHMANKAPSEFFNFYDKAEYIWDLGGGITWDKGRQSLEAFQNNVQGDVKFISAQAPYAATSYPQFFLKYKYRF